MIIHLPVEFPFSPDGHRPVKEKFREESEKLLLQTYNALNIQPLVVSGKLEQRLQLIAETLNLPQQMSLRKAIELATDIRIKPCSFS